jgi:hypothetical protein
VAYAMAAVEPAGHGQWEERFFDILPGEARDAHCCDIERERE